MKIFFCSISFISVVVALLGCTHYSPSGVPPVEKARAVNADERLNKDYFQHNYADLSSLINMTMLTVDGAHYSCKIPSDQLPAISQMLRASLDERFAADKEMYIKKTLQERKDFFPKNCSLDCSCNAYVSFVDYLKQENILLSSTEQKIYKKILVLSATQNSQICAEKQLWVCESKAFKYLYSAQEHN